MKWNYFNRIVTQPLLLIFLCVTNYGHICKATPGDNASVVTTRPQLSSEGVTLSVEDEKTNVSSSFVRSSPQYDKITADYHSQSESLYNKIQENATGSSNDRLGTSTTMANNIYLTTNNYKESFTDVPRTQKQTTNSATTTSSDQQLNKNLTHLSTTISYLIENFTSLGVKTVPIANKPEIGDGTTRTYTAISNSTTTRNLNVTTRSYNEVQQSTSKSPGNLVASQSVDGVVNTTESSVVSSIPESTSWSGTNVEFAVSSPRGFTSDYCNESFSNCINSTLSPVINVPETSCISGQVFCMKTWKCVSNKDACNQSVNCNDNEVFSLKNNACLQQDNNKRTIQKCGTDEVFNLKVNQCEKLGEVGILELTWTTPAPSSLTSTWPKTGMCPSGEIYPLPVEIVCRNDSDCPLQSKCCYISDNDRVALPQCVWIAEFDHCPAFMHFCAYTAKCHVPAHPCQNKCPSGWELCARGTTQKCVQIGSCKNKSKDDFEEQSMPFNLPTLPVPSVTFIPLKQHVLEDEDISFEVSKMFQFTGESDVNPQIKDTLLLRFLGDYLQQDYLAKEFRNWVSKLAAVLSAKTTQLELSATKCDNSLQMNDAVADHGLSLFPCRTGVVVEVRDSSNPNLDTWSNHCIGARVVVRESDLLRIRLSPHFNGNVTLTVAPIIATVEGQLLVTGKTVDVDIVAILPVNDSPVPRRHVSIVDAEFPHIPTMSSRDQDDILGEFFEGESVPTVEDIVSEFYVDPDNDPLGMAVVSAENTLLGVWQYQLPGTEEWKNITGLANYQHLTEKFQLLGNVQGALSVEKLASGKNSVETVSRGRRGISFEALMMLNKTEPSNGRRHNDSDQVKTTGHIELASCSKDLHDVLLSHKRNRLLGRIDENTITYDNVDVVTKRLFPVEKATISCPTLAALVEESFGVLVSTSSSGTTTKTTPDGFGMSTHGNNISESTSSSSSTTSGVKSPTQSTVVVTYQLTSMKPDGKSTLGLPASSDTTTSTSTSMPSTFAAVTASSESRSSSTSMNDATLTRLTTVGTFHSTNEETSEATTVTNSNVHFSDSITPLRTSYYSTSPSASSSSSVLPTDAITTNKISSTDTSRSGTSTRSSSAATAAAPTSSSRHSQEQTTSGNADVSSATTYTLAKTTSMQQQEWTTVSTKTLSLSGATVNSEPTSGPTSTRNSHETTSDSSSTTSLRTTQPPTSITTKSSVNYAGTPAALKDNNVTQSGSSPRTTLRTQEMSTERVTRSFSVGDGSTAANENSVSTSTTKETVNIFYSSSSQTRSVLDLSSASFESSSTVPIRTLPSPSPTATTDMSKSSTTTSTPQNEPISELGEDLELAKGGILSFEANVLFLPPDAKLRFVPNEKVEQWSLPEIVQKTKLVFTAWDRTTNETGGSTTMIKLNICSTSIEDNCLTNGSLSGTFVMIHRGPVDCTSQWPLKSPRLYDDCFTCAGDGLRCLDCSNTVYGGHKNDCNKCSQENVRDCGLECHGNEWMPLKQANSNELCVLNGKLPSSMCNSSNTLLNKCGTCGNSNVDDCGQCITERINVDVLKNHYDHFSCNNTWKSNSLINAVAFGNLPHLEWYEISGSSQTVHVDLAAFQESQDGGRGGGIVHLHFYGLTWSHKRDVFDSVQCIVDDSLKSQAAVSVQAKLEEDRLAISFGSGELKLGDYSVKCQLQVDTDNTSHVLFPVAKLSIVDSRRVHVKNVSPQRVNLAGNDTMLTLTGSGFVDSIDLWCFYTLRPFRYAKLLSRAIFVDSNHAQCLVPTNQFSDACILDLGIVISSATLIAINKKQVTVSTTRLELDGSPPVLLSASTYVNEQVHKLTFDRNVRLRNCSYILKNTRQLGELSHVCDVKANQIVIQFRSTPIENKASVSTLANPNEFRLFNTIASVFAPPANTGGPSGTFKFNLEDTEYVPTTIRLSGANQVCSGIVTMEVLPLSVRLKHMYEFDWSITTTNARSDMAQEQIAAFQNMASQQKSPVFTFSSQMMLPDVPYNIHVKGRTPISAITLTRQLIFLPLAPFTLSIDGPFRIDPQEEIHFMANIVVCPSLKSSLAIKPPQFKFYWEIDTDEVSLEGIRGKLVTIEKNKLEGGRQYTIRCLVIANGNFTTSTVTEFSFITTVGKPKIIISPSKLLVAFSQGFQLDAQKSIDPYKNDAPLKFYWSCRTNNGEACYCVDNHTDVVRLETVYQNEMQRAVLEIPGNVLPVAKYVFRLQVVARDGRSATGEVPVQVTSNTNAPEISLIGGSADGIVPNTEVSLWAQVTASAGTTLIWEGQNEAGFSIFDPSATSSVGWYRHLEKDVKDLVISVVLQQSQSTGRDATNQFWQRLEPESQYRIRLTATHPLDGMSFAEVTLQTLGQPNEFNEIINVSPTVGTALLTPFTVNLTNFLDSSENGNVALFLGYKYVDASEVHILQQLTVSQHIVEDVRLPAVNQNDGKLIVVVKACNKESLCSVSTSAPIVIETPKGFSQSETKILLDAITSRSDMGDITASLHQGISTIKTLQLCGLNSSNPTFGKVVKTVNEAIRKIAYAEQTRLRWGYSSYKTAIKTLRTISAATREICSSSTDSKVSVALAIVSLHTEIMDSIVEEVSPLNNEDIIEDLTMSYNETDDAEQHNSTVRVKRKAFGGKASFRVSSKSGGIKVSSGKKPAISFSRPQTTNVKVQSGGGVISKIKNFFDKFSFGSKAGKAISPAIKNTARPRPNLIESSSATRIYLASTLVRKKNRKSGKNTIRPHTSLNPSNKTRSDATYSAPGSNNSYERNQPKQNEPLDASDIESLLHVTDTIVQYDMSYTGIVTNRLLEDLPEILRQMCHSAAAGQKATVTSRSDSVCVQVSLSSVGDLADKRHQLNCELPGVGRRRNTEYRYDSLSASTACDTSSVESSSGCDTVCLGSAEFVDDPLFVADLLTSDSLKRNRRSNIYVIQGTVPRDTTTDSGLIVVLDISISIDSVADGEVPFLKCATLTNTTWDLTACNTTKIIKAIHDVRVICSCPPSGFYGVFLDEHSSGIVPEEADLEVPAEPTLPTPTSIETDQSFVAEHVYDVSFVFEGDYDKFVSPLGQYEFGEYVKKELAKILNVSNTYFPDIVITKGSIKVELRLAPDPNGPYQNDESLLSHLQELAANNSLCIHGSQNATEHICTRNGSFHINWIDDNQTTASNPPNSVQQGLSSSFVPLNTYRVSFVLIGDYNNSVEQHGKDSFVKHCRTQLAGLFNVTIDYFPFLDVKRGSIAVEMHVTPDPDGQYGGGDELVKRIQQSIARGDLCFKGMNNEQLCAAKDSYAIKKANEEAEKENHSLLGIIIGVTFGIVAALVIACICRAIRNEKRKRNKINAMKEAGPPAYRTIHNEEALLQRTLLDGTIDSREQYRVKVETGAKVRNTTSKPIDDGAGKTGSSLPHSTLLENENAESAVERKLFANKASKNE